MANIVVGSDFTPEISGVRNAATGEFLNSATVTFVLYNAVGTSVTSGSCTYVASSDAVYRGVIESTVTSTLTAGNAYYLIYTVSSSGIDSEHREDLTAVSPGSIIIDVPSWSASTGTSLTAGSAEELSVTVMAEAVAAALTRLCYPILLAPKALMLYACDAPMDNEFFTPVRPCRSISALHLVPGADGDSSLATSDNLLANYTGYVLDIDDALNGWSRSGRVYRRGSSCWGFELRRPLGKLAYAADPNRKAIFLSGQFGPASVSPIVRQAAVLATSLLFERRKKGIPLQSESFNGYSYSNSGPFTVEAAIKTPDVMELLRAAGVLPIHVG